MKLFSFVCVIPAIVSLYTIMSGSCVELAECGRYQKGTLGELMAVGIFVELYLLVLGNWRPIWRFGLLSIYLTLLILSQSVTNWLIATVFLAGIAIYVIGKRDKLSGLIAATTFASLLLLLQLGLWYNADSLLAVFGKNSTLTGRTDIWLAKSRSNKAEAVAWVGLYGGTACQDRRNFGRFALGGWQRA